MSDNEEKNMKMNSSKILMKVTRQHQTLLTLMVMSFQVFVGGISIGLLDTAHHLIILIVAIYIHRMATAVVVGYLVQQDTGSNLRKMIYVTVYGFSTSLGLLLGWVIDIDAVSEGILLAVTAGCLLYICISDIVVKEFSIKGTNWKKFTFFLAGMATENLLWFVEVFSFDTSKSF